MKKALAEILKMQEERNWKQFHSVENLAKSIAIEAGELLECFQWSSEYNEDHVKEELADILNYCLLMANELNVDLEEIVLEKIEINKQKYPINKSNNNAKKYIDFEEDNE
ncbi:MAG: nucleotide pyrophosphohydrolase [Bacilli bacterium]